MALLSFSIPCFLTVRALPHSIFVSHTNQRTLLFRKSLSVTLPRAALSSDDEHPTQPPNEDAFHVSDASSPTEQNFSDSDVNVIFHDSSGDVTSAMPPPVNNVASSHFENQRELQQLQETLATLSQSLAILATSLNEVSSTIGILSASLSSQSKPASARSPSELRDIRERAGTESSSLSLDPPEPWDTSFSQKIADPVHGENLEEEDIVPPHLVEQNRRAHKLAYKLQQSFIQARIEGLGKPFEVAVEDFTDACMDAHALGIGLKELQLQLVLQDGSLRGAFAIRNQRWSNDPILNDESRVRALWVRLVYSTLVQLEPGNNEMQEGADPTDSFVKQVLDLAVSQGYDLERFQLEQTFAGREVTSGAVKAMRENQYLILLTLEKARPKSQ